jgi:tetratricopeptide (TPR) repeat protein
MRALLLLWAGLASAAPQSAYDAGIDALRSGDHTRARDHFVTAVEGGARDPAVYHGLGNALYRMGDAGGALAAWRRGLRLEPRNGDIAANIDRVRKTRKDRLPPPPQAPGAFFWMAVLSPRDGALLAALGATLALGGLLVRGLLARSGRRLARVGLETWAGALLATLMLVSTVAAVRSETGVVVRADEVVARSALGPEGVELFALHAGAEATLLEVAGEHVLVGLPDERKGWVSAEAVVSTDPAAPFPR